MPANPQQREQATAWPSADWISRLESAIRYRDRGLLSHAIGLWIFCLALGVRFFISPALPLGLPFLSFFPAVLLTAIFAGFGPALVVAAASCLWAWTFFLPTMAGTGLETASMVALVLFFALCLLQAVIIEGFVRARGEIAALRARGPAPGRLTEPQRRTLDRFIGLSLARLAREETTAAEAHRTIAAVVDGLASGRPDVALAVVDEATERSDRVAPV